MLAVVIVSIIDVSNITFENTVFYIINYFPFFVKTVRRGGFAHSV